MITEDQMQLAVDWRGTVLIDGWLASEKLNGCRAYWDGRQFWTRGGNVIDAPKWFTRGLPATHLDGEINCGRDGRRGKMSFEVARVAVQNGGKWFDETSPITSTPIRFTAFDAPEVAGNWQQRMSEVGRAVNKAAHAAAIAFQKIRMAGTVAKLAPGEMDFNKYVLPLAKAGCEGFMFRNPEAAGYEAGRSKNLLRFKLLEN